VPQQFSTPHLLQTIAIYSRLGRLGLVMNYDDTKSITNKVQYAVGNRLRGYFACHVGGDDNDWTLSRTG
jgi:GH18 family chitinase